MGANTLIVYWPKAPTCSLAEGPGLMQTPSKVKKRHCWNLKGKM